MTDAHDGMRLTIVAGGAGDDAGDGVTVVHLNGYLDESTQRSLATEIRRTFQSGCHRILLDLDGVSFMTSTGLAALVELWTTAREAGGDLVVINPPPSISVLLRVLKLNEMIVIAESEEAARSHFQNLASLPEALPADDESKRPDPLDPLPGDGDA